MPSGGWTVPYTADELEKIWMATESDLRHYAFAWQRSLRALRDKQSQMRKRNDGLPKEMSRVPALPSQSDFFKPTRVVRPQLQRPDWFNESLNLQAAR